MQAHSRLGSKITVKVAFKKKISRLGKAAHSESIVSAYSLGTCDHTHLVRHERSNVGTNNGAKQQNLQAPWLHGDSRPTFEASSGTCSTCGTARAFTDLLDMFRSPAMVS